MPRLSCWSCGRQIYTVAPLEALFAEERRCPRCGAFLREDRRETERRTDHRRKNPQHDPGPPPPTPAPESMPAVGAGRTPKGAAKPEPTAIETEAAANERRLAERRSQRRRGASTSRSSAPPIDPPA